MKEGRREDEQGRRRTEEEGQTEKSSEVNRQTQRAQSGTAVQYVQ